MGYIPPHKRVLTSQVIEEVKGPYVPIHLRLTGITASPTKVKTASSGTARPKTPSLLSTSPKAISTPRSPKLNATAATFTPFPPRVTPSPPRATPPHPLATPSPSSPTPPPPRAPKYNLSMKPHCPGLAGSMWAHSTGKYPAPQKKPATLAKRVDSVVSNMPSAKPVTKVASAKAEYLPASPAITMSTTPSVKEVPAILSEKADSRPASPVLPSIGQPATSLSTANLAVIEEAKLQARAAILEPSPLSSAPTACDTKIDLSAPSWSYTIAKPTKPASDGSSVVTAFSSMSPQSQMPAKSTESTPITALSKQEHPLSPIMSAKKLENAKIEQPEPALSFPSTNGHQYTYSTKDAYSMAFNKYHRNHNPVQVTWKPRRSKAEKQPGGWLTPEEKKAMARRLDDQVADGELVPYDDGGFGNQEDIDWNAPNQLVDWEGKILPAPVEWTSRHQCQRDNWANFIISFIEKSQPHYIKKGDQAVSTTIIDTSHESFVSSKKGTKNGEVVPKEWIAHNIENQTLQSFWKSLLQIVPSPVDEADLQGPPFWQRYNHGTDILEPVKHEDAKCEPVKNDLSPEYFLWKTGTEQTAELAIKKHNDKANAKERQEKNERRMKKEDLAAALKRAQEIPLPNPLKPTASFYLRPLSVSRDVAGLLDIYNHYATNSFQAVDNAAVDLSTLTRHLEDLRATALPMIVAIERGPGAKHKSRFQSTPSTPEKIIGYATTDQGSASKQQMSHLAHLEIYVHPDYARKGVGKNLLDRMLWLLDPTYRIQSDVSWNISSRDLSYSMPGGKRAVSAVRVGMFYGEDEKNKSELVGAWLGKFAFEKQADFGRAGVKMGQWTRQAIWVRECDTGLDPKTIVRS